MKITTKISRHKRIELAETELFELLCRGMHRIELEEDISYEVINSFTNQNKEWKITFIYNEKGWDVFLGCVSSVEVKNK
jgi:hypothetical protein